MVSTVVWKRGSKLSSLAVGVSGPLSDGERVRPESGWNGDGDAQRLASSLESLRLDSDDIMLCEKYPDPTRFGYSGVWAPDAEVEFCLALAGASASRDACRSRFVVPSALVWVLRALHTMATLLSGRYDLGVSGLDNEGAWAAWLWADETGGVGEVGETSRQAQPVNARAGWHSR